jgi:hypothetical protein
VLALATGASRVVVRIIRRQYCSVDQALEERMKLRLINAERYFAPLYELSATCVQLLPMVLPSSDGKCEADDEEEEEVLWQYNSASAQVGGTGREKGCVGAALPATAAGPGEFGLEGTERVLVLVGQVQ